MIYLDTSVALAELLAEDRRPPDALWKEPLVSSRLLEYELWTRVNARGAARTHGEAVREILARVSLVELAPTVLARALEPFPTPVRTLDALHLATAHFLQANRQKLAIATYDERMRECAKRTGIMLANV
jgi:predicted nucleic acid-binding protein